MENQLQNLVERLSQFQPRLDDLIGLRKLARFARLRQVASSRNAGGHVSPFRGRGMDFSEVRSYQAGDDIRHMDWRVTARTGRPHTKLYTEERERPVHLLVDFGASMWFGSRVQLKVQLAAQLAAALAWHARAEGDRLGGVVAAGESLTELPPRAGDRAVLRFLNTLASQPPQVSPESRLGEAVESLWQVARPGALVFLISDFRDWGEQAARALRLLRRHCQPYLLMVADPLEHSPPDIQAASVSDGLKRFRISARAEGLSHEFHSRHERMQELARQLALPLQLFSTEQDWLGELQRMLVTTGGRGVR